MGNATSACCSSDQVNDQGTQRSKNAAPVDKKERITVEAPLEEKKELKDDKP